MFINVGISNEHVYLRFIPTVLVAHQELFIE